MAMFFLRFVFVVVACLAVVACAPFNRGTFDNRPKDYVEVQSVAPNGNIDLADGRVVRLFAVQVPQNKGQRDRFIPYLSNRLKGQTVTVEDVIPGEPAAVSMVLWERGFVCGNGLMTWDPWARPFDLYQMMPVSRDLLMRFEGVLKEEDLNHVDADPHLVESLRRFLHLEATTSE